MKRKLVANFCIFLFFANTISGCSNNQINDNNSGLRTNNTSMVLPVMVSDTSTEIIETTEYDVLTQETGVSEEITEIVEVTLRNTDDWVLDLENIDIDLTLLSSTMVYSEVYNMMTNPNDYIGKSIKMTGKYIAYTNQYESKYYPAIIIADATACCSQGMEFVLDGNPPYPEAYPTLETETTVVGIFDTYEENGIIYCHLIKSVIE